MIPDSIYPISGDFKAARWRESLCRSLGLVADKTVSLNKTFIDSFDWRLYRAGLYLERNPAEQGSLLRLLQLHNASAEAELQVPGDARFYWDLPETGLRDQLRQLLEMRAMLPMFEMRIRSQELRQVDKEGKTRARLFLESCRLLNGTSSRLVMNRLRLEPVRGYAKAGARVHKHLQKNCRLKPCADDLYVRVLQLTNTRAGEYSNKLNIKLEAETRSDAAVREVLQDLLRAMDLNHQGTVEDLDSEFLHDFRVAVRRTRSMLSEVRSVFPAATLKRFRTEFKWLGGVTSEVRDLDVYLLKFERYRQAVPEEMRPGMEPLREFLIRQQELAQKKHLAPALVSARYRRLRSQWQRFLTAPLAKRPTAADAGRPILDVAQRKTWRMYKRVMREGKAIQVDSPHEDLHELRKSCKKLRYLMEFFLSLFPAGQVRGLIKELKRLQDNLGDFQDLEVQIHALHGFAEQMRNQGLLATETEQAMNALAETLQQEMTRVRADFEERFERFASMDTKTRFKQLFRPMAAEAPA